MMRHGLRLGAALLGVALLAPAVASAAAAPPAPHPGSARAQLQQALNAVVAAGATGATAEVADGRYRVHASSGVAVRGSSRPVPTDGRFRVGSVSKTFVATVILQLVAEHRLALDDTVDDVLPGVLPRGSGITVRELLNHTSGIPEVLTTFPRPGTPEFLNLRWRTWTTRQLVDRVADAPLLFEPGTQASYSNTNYLVLGMIIERATGLSYATAIERRIIRPLRLHGTSLPGRDPSIRGPHAHGYMAVQEPDGSTSMVDVTAWNPTLMNAAGDIISTTRDLNRFYDALLNGRLLPAYLMTQMRIVAPGSIYGLGVIKHRLSCGVIAWGKDGDAPGYSTWSFSTPDGRKRVTVSVTWGVGDPDNAVDDLLDTELCP